MDVKNIILVLSLYSASGTGDMQAHAFPIFSSSSAVLQSLNQVGDRVLTSSTRLFIKRTGIVLGIAAAAYLIYRFARPVRRLPAISEQEFRAALDDVQKVLSNRYDAMAWLQDARPPVTDKEHIIITQKIMLPQHADVRFVGDIHGDADALKSFFKALQKQNVINAELVLKKDVYYVFLGDYVDRGTNGVETWCLLSKFLKNNPGRVFLLRGNHEDFEINFSYGFREELCNRFGDAPMESMARTLQTFYNLLPSALFLGYQKPNGTIGYIVCCHGNLEFGYNPRDLLLYQSNNVGQWVKQLSKKDFFDKLDQRIKATFGWGANFEENEPGITATQNQFIWGRQPDRDDKQSRVSGVGVQYGPMFFNAVAQAWQSPGKFSIDAIVRGHDHAAAVKVDGFQRVAEYNLPFYTIISACPVGVRPASMMPTYQFTCMQTIIDDNLVFTPTVLQPYRFWKFLF